MAHQTDLYNDHEIVTVIAEPNDIPDDVAVFLSIFNLPHLKF